MEKTCLNGIVAKLRSKNDLRSFEERFEYLFGPLRQRIGLREHKSGK